MEDAVRYLIIGISFTYIIHRIKSIIWDKNYGCSTCSMNSSCNKKSCSVDNVSLTDMEREKIKKIKLAYKN